MVRWGSIFLQTVWLFSVDHHSAEAHTLFKKPFQEQYELRTATCFACHAKGKDERTGKPFGKDVYSEFGQELAKLLEERQITGRIQDAIKLEKNAKEKIHEQVIQEFLEALSKLDAMESPHGPTWGEYIRDGKLPETRLKKKRE
jgi:hypothetical protein